MSDSPSLLQMQSVGHAVDLLTHRCPLTLWWPNQVLSGVPAPGVPFSVLVLLPLPLLSAWVAQWKFSSSAVMLEHIGVDTVISAAAAASSVKEQIWRETASVFNSTLTAASFLHTLIKWWQRCWTLPVTFPIIKCIYTVSDNVKLPSPRGKWDCKWHKCVCVCVC